MSSENALILKQFHEREFAKESDRAAVILTASLIDSALDSLIRARLVSISSANDELMDGPNAPLGSLSSKIDLAHRIGLISPQFAQDLHLVRKVRNDFAHDVQGANFKQIKVAQRITQLCASSKMIQKDPEARKKYGEGIRGDFLMVTSWMLFHISWLSAETERIDAMKPEFHYSPLGDKDDPRRKTVEEVREQSN